MVPGIQGKAPYLTFSEDRLFLFFVTPDRRKLGYTTYNGRRWNQERYHRLDHAAHDVVVAVQEEHPETFHLLYTSESDKRIYHVIGTAR
jgi:hypothetical protein